MKPNPNKFQFMVLGKSTRQSIILNNNIKIRESSSVVLLGVTIDNQLTWKGHINIYRRANLKLHVLRRIRKYLTTVKAKLLYNAFINSQFKYASIIWMFCHKQDYLEIAKIQYKTWKIVYNSNQSYEELLLRNNEVSIHQKQLHILATEVFKSLADINPDFMKSYFTIREKPYCLQNGIFLKTPRADSIHYGTNSVLFQACLVWNNLPLSVKQSQSSLIELKSKIKVFKK